MFNPVSLFAGAASALFPPAGLIGLGLNVLSSLTKNGGGILDTFSSIAGQIGGALNPTGNASGRGAFPAPAQAGGGLGQIGQILQGLIGAITKVLDLVGKILGNAQQPGAGQGGNPIQNLLDEINRRLLEQNGEDATQGGNRRPQATGGGGGAAAGGGAPAAGGGGTENAGAPDDLPSDNGGIDDGDDPFVVAMARLAKAMREVADELKTIKTNDPDYTVKLFKIQMKFSSLQKGQEAITGAHRAMTDAQGAVTRNIR